MATSRSSRPITARSGCGHLARRRCARSWDRTFSTSRTPASTEIGARCGFTRYACTWSTEPQRLWGAPYAPTGGPESALWRARVAARLFLGLPKLGLDVRVGFQLVNSHTELCPAGHFRLQVRERNAEILRDVQGRYTLLNTPESCARFL